MTPMKKIINQKRYDTETATARGSWDNGYSVRDFHYCGETLYQKKTGEFFLYGEGGPASKYSRQCGNNSWSSDCDIIPLTYDAAREWAEEHLGADDYEEIFGEVTEDGSKVFIGFSLPTGTVEKLKRLAAQTGRQQSDIVTELINNMKTD